MSNNEAKQKLINDEWISLIGGTTPLFLNNKIDKNGWYTGNAKPSDYGIESDLVHVIPSKNGLVPDLKKWRPKSLLGIEDNNGWTKIQYDLSNLPEDDESYDWLMLKHDTIHTFKLYENPLEIIVSVYGWFRPSRPFFRPKY